MNVKWIVKLDGEVQGSHEHEVADALPGRTVLSAVTTFDVVVNGRAHPVEVTAEFDPPPVIQ